MSTEQVGCRRWIEADTNCCFAPARYIVWGKMFKPEHLGPRCKECFLIEHPEIPVHRLDQYAVHELPNQSPLRAAVEGVVAELERLEGQQSTLASHGIDPDNTSGQARAYEKSARLLRKALEDPAGAGRCGGCGQRHSVHDPCPTLAYTVGQFKAALADTELVDEVADAWTEGEEGLHSTFVRDLLASVFDAVVLPVALAKQHPAAQHPPEQGGDGLSEDDRARLNSIAVYIERAVAEGQIHPDFGARDARYLRALADKGEKR